MKSFSYSLIAFSIVIGIAGFSASAMADQSNAIKTVQIEREQAQFSELRHRWASYFLGNNNLPTNAKLNAEIASINTTAKQLLATISISKNGLWQDLPLDAESSSGRQQLGIQLYSTYLRVFTLARAYKLVGGELAGDPELLHSLIETLAFLNEHFYQVGTAEYGNWWQWELGISRTVNNTLVLLYDDIPFEIVNNYIEATRYFVPKSTHLSAGYGAPYSSAPMIWESTGGNRTDNAQVVLIRGLLDENTNEVKQAIDALSSVIPYVESGDGFYQDGSYIQHKDLPYSGTYGQVMIEGLGMLLGVVANTQFQATDPNLQKIYPLIMQSYAPLLVDGRMMDFVNGRAISRLSGQNDKVGQSILSAMLLYVEGAPKEYKHQFETFLKSQLDSTNGLQSTRILSNYQLADSLMRTREVKQTPNVSHIQFADMDRIVHHRDDWSFGIAMHSDRVGNYESINGENLKGWHTADGMTYLYNKLDHYNAGYWAIVDPYKLAGTTTLLTKRLAEEGQLSAQRDGRNGAMTWTGGTRLDQYGVAGMKFTNASRDLSAKKSWFMFDEQVVALGSDIDNSSNAQAVTTIENRLVNPKAILTIDNNIVTSDFSGQAKEFSIQYTDINGNEATIQYSIMDNSAIDVTKQCRSGNYADIGTDDLAVRGCFYEATINHSDDNNSYAYMITPSGKNISDDIHIIANNTDVHAVQHQSLNLFAANFWNGAKVGSVESASSMAIMTKEENGLVTVSVADPTRSWFDRDFTIDGQFEVASDSENLVELEDGNQFSVDLSDLSGSSYTFTLKRIK